MTLSFDQIRAVTQGAVRTEILDGSLCLHRFTRDEQQMYRTRRQESYLRSFATAGIRLEFETESEALFLKVSVYPSTSRRWFAHSVFVNERRIGALCGRLEPESLPLQAEKRFDLGPGRKRVKVYFPWSVESRIRELSLDDGAVAVPVAKSRRLLSYGDSITQGYDAPSPEEAYIVKLSDAIDAELICKAIGGERFCPALAQLCEEPEPDLITVAYGTNDWSLSSRDEFLWDSRAFFLSLRQRFPAVPILALAPIWRADIHTRQRDVGEFAAVAAQLREISRAVPGMTVIDCRDFVPQEASFFADQRLHPNGEGFRHYTEGLLKALGL